VMLAELIPTLDRLINDDLKDSMSIDGSQLRVSLAGKAAKKLVLEVRFNGTQPSRDQQYQYTTDAMRHTICMAQGLDHAPCQATF